MATRRSRQSVKNALREKFGSPREALKALGLDESLLDVRSLAQDGAKHMAKNLPTRIAYLALTRTARGVRPLLATDAKIDLGPLFSGLTTKNFKQRKPLIMDGLKKLLKGKTIAKDATMEHVAKMLDSLEHVNEPKSLDESVSGPQHRAMEAAAHGTSNLGIPKSVGKEFEHADKGKSFRDALPAFLKDHHGMGDDDVKKIMDMLPGESALGADDEEGEEVNIEVEEGEDADIEEEEAEDTSAEDEIEEEEAEDEDNEPDPAKDRRGGGKDNKGAKDHAMRNKPKPITQDDVNKIVQAAVATERKKNSAAAEARAFVRPYVGELPMALDSAEKIHRAAAKALGIEEAETIHPSALRALIKMQPRQGMGQDDRNGDMATDEGSSGTDGTAERFPDAGRIMNA